MRQFFVRHQPAMPNRQALIAGIGGLIAIAAAAGLTQLSGTPLLMAPFGASCVLLFSVAASPLSQPINVVGGHILASIVGLALRAVLPNEWWAVGIAVGLAIGLMAALRITHPPAGADPIVIFAADPEWAYLATPVVTGSVLLVVVAYITHRLSGTQYPLPRKD